MREKAPPTPASPHTLLINHPNIKIWGERQRTTGSLTNTTIPGNRVEPGRRSRSVDLWVPVMKSRSFSLQSRVTPKTLKKKKHPPFFLADFPPRPHTVPMSAHAHACNPRPLLLSELFRRTVHLGKIDQTSGVISQLLIHTEHIDDLSRIQKRSLPNAFRCSLQANCGSESMNNKKTE